MPNLNPITQLPEVEEPAEYSGMDKFSAGLALQNPYSAYFHPSYVPFEHHEVVEGYEPFDDPQTEGYPREMFVGSMSSGETTERIERTKSNQSLLQVSQGGIGFVGEMFGAVFNPNVLAPAFLSGGTSIYGMVAAEMAGESINEMFLHSQQPLRTKIESAINIGLVGVFSYGLGRVTGYGTTPRLEGAPPGPRVVVEDGPWEGDRSIGAAMTSEAGGEAPVAFKDAPQEGAGEVKSTGLFGKIVSKTSPAGDIIHNSPSLKAKLITQRLVDTVYRYEPGKKVPISVESAVKQAEGDIASMTGIASSQYKAYKEAGGIESRKVFHEMVSDAMRNGDVHEISQAVEVARFFRKFDQKYFNDAVRLGMYGTDPPKLKGAKSHLQRVFDRQKVLEGYPSLKRLIAGKIMTRLMNNDNYILVKYFDEKLGFDEYRAIHAKHLPEVEEAFGKVKVVAGDELEDFSEEALGEAAIGIARSVIHRMLGGDVSDVTAINHLVPEAGSLHERTLGWISDAELKPYLESDALTTMAITARQMTRSIEMTREFGSIDMKAAIRSIENEYDELIDAAKTGNERKKLNARRVKDIKNIKGMRDLVLGTYGKPKDPTSAFVRFGLISRSLAMLSYGANITSSSLSDLVSPALRYGLRPFNEGLRVLTSNTSKEYIQYVQRLGIAVESVTNQRASALAEMAFTNKFAHTSMRMFGKYTGLNLLTDVSQALNAIGTSNMWIKWMTDMGKVSKKNRQKLLDVGIDNKLAKEITNQIKMYGKKSGDVTMPESHLWRSKQGKLAARAFENALRKEVNTTSLIPGKGDIPLALKTEAGKFFAMFTSFLLSSQQRWILAGVQRADAEWLTGMLMLSATGMMVSAGKYAAFGKDVSDKEPIDWILDGMDRGGALGLFALPIGWIRLGFDDSTPSRYIGKSATEQLLIPPGIKYAERLITPMIKVMRGEELSDSDSWNMIKAIPLANTFHAVDIMRQAAE